MRRVWLPIVIFQPVVRLPQGLRSEMFVFMTVVDSAPFGLMTVFASHDDAPGQIGDSRLYSRSV
jgi:hypothetical protein